MLTPPSTLTSIFPSSFPICTGGIITGRYTSNSLKCISTIYVNEIPIKTAAGVETVPCIWNFAVLVCFLQGVIFLRYLCRSNVFVLTPLTCMLLTVNLVLTKGRKKRNFPIYDYYLSLFQR